MEVDAEDSRIPGQGMEFVEDGRMKLCSKLRSRYVILESSYQYNTANAPMRLPDTQHLKCLWMGCLHVYVSVIL